MESKLQKIRTRVHRLTQASFYMTLVTLIVVYLKFDDLSLLSMLAKGGLSVTTFYLVYLRHSAVISRRKASRASKNIPENI